jgi:glycine hydroxymethyltransferase
MVDAAHFTGLIAAGLSPNPIPHADIVTASTTKTLCGPHSGFIMCKKLLADAVEKSVYPGHVASVHLQTIAAMAYALHNAATPGFRQLMQRVVNNASALSDALLKHGFDIFTGGTDCHMLLAAPRSFGIDGVRLAAQLEEIGEQMGLSAERVREIARMLSGDASEAALAHARELLG